jgi:hypothetical protein
VQVNINILKRYNLIKPLPTRDILHVVFANINNVSLFVKSDVIAISFELNSKLVE